MRRRAVTLAFPLAIRPAPGQSSPVAAGPPSRTPLFERRIPDGDEHPRLVCTDCGFIQYENPKLVVGAVVHVGDRILMCRRAIEPRTGFWTLPAGYLEAREEPAAGARREAWEEARARIEIETLLAVYTITRISQVQLIFRARLAAPEISAGPESLEVALFTWDEIPWSELAFPSARWALHHFAETRTQTVFAPRANPPGETGDD
jgi:ADP-ribose pyrophosphatase YjhB (NUDIX family)